jgi:3-vinyl bacteriochlorophyllide hydratase
MSYTPDQLRRRNESLWTPVQGVAAPLQFLTFVASLVLVIRYFSTGQGYEAAHVASSIKVVMMIFITVTGMAWEFDVYGHYFLAKEFFWEDLVNAISLVLHLAFIATWVMGASERTNMLVMLVALASYVVNFIQFGRRGLMAARQRKQLANGNLVSGK